MATKRGASRREVEEELVDDPIVVPASRRSDPASDVDVDEVRFAETYELPGADLSGESLAVEVIPVQKNEFTCVRCYIVNHRARMDHDGKNGPVCVDCA